MTRKQLPITMSFIVFSLATCFYFYDFVLQVIPGVFSKALSKSFSLDAEELGGLSAIYFLSYSFMQIPAGILYDKYGGRIVITCAVIIASLGTYLFSLSDNVIIGNISRILMGAGSAFAFLGALYLILRWFPNRYFATMTGIVGLMGSLGAMFGEIFLTQMLKTFSWRTTLSIMAVIGGLLAITIWLIVRNHPFNDKDKTTLETSSNFKREIRYLTTHSQIWALSIYCFLNWSTASVFAILWGIPYLTKVFDMSMAQASLGISLIWAGVGIASPVAGWVSDHIKLRKPPLIICSLIAITGITVILFIPYSSLENTYITLFCLGISISAPTVIFATAKDIVPLQTRNLCNGLINMSAVTSGLVLQPIIGIIMDILWRGNTSNNIRTYTDMTYRTSLIVLLVAATLSLIIAIFWIKETHCKDLNND